MATPADRVRHVLNWCNLSTPVGLAIARLGGARIRRGERLLFEAEGYRLRFPVAGAFTVGDVVTTASTFAGLEARTPGVMGHERRHALQYALAGPWFLPAYLAGAAWSLLRTGDPAIRNPLERHAGLITGGYVHPETGVPLGTPWPWRRALRRLTSRRGVGPTASPGGTRASGGAA